MPKHEDIVLYNKSLDADYAVICAQLFKLFERELNIAEAKVWHGHPVWFLDSNPVVGYSVKKTGVHVLFWSGQSFKFPGLELIGKYKAAEYKVESLGAAEKAQLTTWLWECKEIQWDYANLPKKRNLEKLTKF